VLKSRKERVAGRRDPARKEKTGRGGSRKKKTERGVAGLGVLGRWTTSNKKAAGGRKLKFQDLKESSLNAV